METYAATITNELVQTSIAQNNLPKLVCPKCKSQQLITTRDKIVKCPDEFVTGLQFRNVCGVQIISIADIESLITKGKTSLIKGMKSKAGKKFDAYIVLNEDYRTEDYRTTFEFEKSKGGKYP